MENNETKISVEDFTTAATTGYIPTIQKEWNGLTLEVKKALSLTGMLSFVETVVENCFEEDTGAYRPELRDFVTRCAIVDFYSNVTLPEDINDKYDLIYSCDIVAVIAGCVEANQFNTMIGAIEKRLEHRAQNNIQGLTTQLNDVISGFSDIEKQLSKTFDGISSDDIAAITSAINNGSFDEDKLVSAIMNRSLSGEGE